MCSSRLQLTYLLLLFNSILLIEAQRERFSAFWNVPSRNCFQRKINISLEQFGIKANDGQEFYGRQVNTFYEDRLGLYPRFNDSKSLRSAFNGGIPQKVDLTAHLLKAKRDIEAAIPDSGFGGVAIIDYEAWRPLWSMNWGSKRIYKSASVIHVKQRYPQLSNRAARQIAIREFNKAAFKFMMETVKLGIQLRPYAKWGFYGFPYCNYDAGKKGEYECNLSFQKYNDKLKTMLEASIALFPSIYLSNEAEDGVNFRYTQAVLRETKRIATKFEPTKPAIAYTKLAYNPYKDSKWFYLKRDICSSVKQVSDLGLQGIIIWSTSKDMNRDRCQAIATYVNENYGPYVELVRRHAEKCAQRRCSGRGQCVLKPQTECSSFKDQYEYQCECDSPFYGAFCHRNRDFTWLYDRQHAEKMRQNNMTPRRLNMRENNIVLSL